MLRKTIILVLVALSCNLHAQFVPEHISNNAIYTFLDDLATIRIISLNSAIKPYSREFIRNKLDEASRHKDQLSSVQKKELQFYLKAYRLESTGEKDLFWKEPLNLFRKQAHIATSLNPFGFSYKDTLFTFQIRPVYGFNLLKNDKGDISMTHGGLEAFATIGRWALYASFRDAHESELLGRPGYYTLHQGGAFKENNGGRSGGDYSEMRGGITYAWKWGDIGLVKDHFIWGDNYHGSNIFSGRAPSFAHIRFHIQPVKWLELNYVHGWLASEVIDSINTYTIPGRTREVYKQKFLAANMITVTPFHNFNFSFGNSIVYADLGGPHPAYFIPVAFYKSIDHTLNHAIDNQNSQLFFNVSSRQIKHVHLFASVFVDEFSITRLKNKEAHNFLSWKGGFRLCNFPARNINLYAEVTQTTPITYKHDVPVVTYASNLYPLGHYMMDNSRELSLGASYNPVPRLHLSLNYSLAEHGNEYAYLRSSTIANMPMLNDIVWKASILDLSINYQFLNNAYLFAGYKISSITGNDADGFTAQYYLDKFTPAFYQGETRTLRLGFCLGF
jgi:hypothetical protein